MSTRSGLELAVLMSAGIAASGESLARFPGRSANIFVGICRFLKEPEKPDHLKQSRVSESGLDLMLWDIHLGYELW